jgi:TRAP-type C4-dicarboxylate transport system permease small subunit
MNRLIQIENRVNLILEVIVTLLFFFVLSLTIILVIMRYGFNSAIIGGNEAMNYLFIYTTALGAAVSVGKKDHIRISYIVDKLRGRKRRFIEILNHLLIGFINAVLIWYSVPWIQSAGSFESPVLRIPNWMVQVSVPIGCTLVILYCLNHVLIDVLDWYNERQR